MELDRQDRDALSALLPSHEDWLMERILFYAERQAYTQSIRALKKVWRHSIVGLSNAIIKTLRLSTIIPEMTPATDYLNFPGAQFGVYEAKRHRTRGVNLAIFLGVMKYYRQAYLDLVNHSNTFGDPDKVLLYIHRFFDRTEVACCTEWCNSESNGKIKIAINQLAAGIADEIKTPAQTIGDNIRFLQKTFDEIAHLLDLQRQSLKGSRDDIEADCTIEMLNEKMDLLDWEFLAEEIPAAIRHSQASIDRIIEILIAVKDVSPPEAQKKAEGALGKWKYFAHIDTDFNFDFPISRGLPEGLIR